MPAGQHVEDPYRRLAHFLTDAVTGQKCDVVLHLLTPIFWRSRPDVEA